MKLHSLFTTLTAALLCAALFNVPPAAAQVTDSSTLANLPISKKGTAMASAATVDLSTADGDFVHITGTTTITALGTVMAGREITLVFDGALTFTHNATSLILPAGANITTAAGDVAVMRSEGSGNWRCVNYSPGAGGAAVTLSGAESLSNKTLVSPVISTGLTASGSASNDFSSSTGTFKSSTGANTLGGDTTLAAGKDLSMASGDGATDLSAGTGVFKSNTGANTLGGAVTVNDATTPSITTAAGKTNTGYVQINGKTSGALKLIAADATAQTVTVATAAQTSGAATATIADMQGVAGTVGISQASLAVSLTADDQAVTPGPRRVIQLASDNATDTNRTFTLSATGAITGAVYVIVGPASNACELADTSIQKLSATWSPAATDTLTLLFDGTNFIELARTDN